MYLHTRNASAVCDDGGDAVEIVCNEDGSDYDGKQKNNEIICRKAALLVVHLTRTHTNIHCN